MKKKVTHIQMPRNIFFNNDISATAKLLYCLLYDMSRAEKSAKKEEARLYVTIKQKKLAEMMNLSTRQLIRVLQELEEHYFIRKERYANDVNQYYILPPEMLPGSEKYMREVKI